jgi:hypothetical protein
MEISELRTWASSWADELLAAANGAHESDGQNI